MGGKHDNTIRGALRRGLTLSIANVAVTVESKAVIVRISTPSGAACIAIDAASGLFSGLCPAIMAATLWERNGDRFVPAYRSIFPPRKQPTCAGGDPKLPSGQAADLPTDPDPAGGLCPARDAGTPQGGQVLPWLPWAPAGWTTTRRK